MHITYKTYRNITISLILVLVVLFAAAITARVRQLEKQNATHDKHEITTLIAHSLDGLRTQAPRDRENKQFIPEVRLELPEAEDSVGLVSYNVISTNNPLQISVSSDLLTNSKKNVLLADASLTHEQILEKVGPLHACSRGVYVTTEVVNDPGYGKSYGSKKLKNGQTVYFYSEDLCKSQDLIDYVKKIESY